MVRPSRKRASGGLRVWNGFRPGASARCDFGSSEKPTPRFCQTDAGARQDDARAELEIDRLDEGDGAGRSGRSRPSRPCRPSGRRADRAKPGACRSWSASASSHAGVEIGLEVAGEGRVGDLAVADHPGALGRLDQAVDVLEALGALDLQPVEQAEDDERGDALRRRRHVEHGRIGDRDGERRHQAGALRREVGAGHRAAGGFEVGRRSRARCRRGRSRRSRRGRGAPACR